MYKGSKFNCKIQLLKKFKKTRLPLSCDQKQGSTPSSSECMWATDTQQFNIPEITSLLFLHFAQDGPKLSS